MRSINEAHVRGNLTGDARVEAGTAKRIVSFRLAMDNPRYVGRELVNRADYITVTVFGNPAADKAAGFRKGDLVDAKGRIRSYSRRTRYGMESGIDIEADEVALIESAGTRPPRRSGGHAEPEAPREAEAQAAEESLEGAQAREADRGAAAEERDRKEDWEEDWEEDWDDGPDDGYELDFGFDDEDGEEER